MSAKEIFERAYNAIGEDQVIVEQEEWSNGTGYYSGLVGEKGPRLLPGVVRKFLSANKRRVIVIGTPFGNVAVFDRYTQNEEGVWPGPCVTNVARDVERLKLFDRGAVSERDMSLLVGSWGRINKENIGFDIVYLVEVIEDNKKRHAEFLAKPY